MPEKVQKYGMDTILITGEIYSPNLSSKDNYATTCR